MRWWVEAPGLVRSPSHRIWRNGRTDAIGLHNTSSSVEGDRVLCLYISYMWYKSWRHCRAGLDTRTKGQWAIEFQWILSRDGIPTYCIYFYFLTQYALDIRVWVSFILSYIWIKYITRCECRRYICLRGSRYVNVQEHEFILGRACCWSPLVGICRWGVAVAFALLYRVFETVNMHSCFIVLWAYAKAAEKPPQSIDNDSSKASFIYVKLNDCIWMRINNSRRISSFV